MLRKLQFRQSSSVLSGICALCAILLLQVSLLQAQEKKTGTSKVPKSLVTDKTQVTVKPQELLVTIDVAGLYEATVFDEIVLQPKQWKTLKVKKVIAHGDAVTEGDPILWLETKKLDKEIEKQKRALVNAELSLRLASDELRFLAESTAMDLDRSDRAAQIAKEELDYFLKVREQRSLKAAELSLKFAKYSLEYSQEELNQLQQMYEADDLTEQTEEIILKRAQRAVEMAEFSLKSSELKHKRTLTTLIPREKQSLVDTDAKAALNRAKSIASLPLLLQKKEIAVDSLQRAVKELNKKVAELSRDRESMTIYADRSGIVYYGRCVNGKWSEISTRAKQLKPTGTVPVDTVLMTIVDPTKLQVRLSLTESQLAQAKIGQAAFVQSNGVLNQSSNGQLTEVNPVQQSAGKYVGIVVAKNNPEVFITPGMTCKVKIRVHQNKKAILLPLSMVHRDIFSSDQRPYVWLKKGDVVKQFVETGYTHAGKIEILSGVNPADIVSVKKP